MSAVLSITEIIAALDAPHENILQMSSAELAKLFERDDGNDLVGRVTDLRSFRGRQPKRRKPHWRR
jgi:hypothetical protein